MQEQAVQQRRLPGFCLSNDEPTIILTMPVILRQHGYDMTAVGTNGQ